MNFNPKTEEDINNITDLNQQDSLYGNTVLHILIKANSPLIDYLLTKNVNVNIQNKEGRTPIFYAKTSVTMDKLVKKGASLFIKDHTGKTVGGYNQRVFTEYTRHARCTVS